MNRRLVMTLILLTLAFIGVVNIVGAQAQSGGQFCVRAFEDRNGNSAYDAGEPLLTRGLSAQLMDARGVVVATGLLEDSPTAAQGVICFTGLTFGQYSLQVTSADYTAQEMMLAAAISEGQLPTVFDFAAQRINLPTTSTSSTTVSADQERIVLLERLTLAALGALAVIVIMLVIGLIVYLLAFRGRTAQTVPDIYQSPRVTTGSNPVVRASDTGEFTKM
jgi:hypothetical protein